MAARRNEVEFEPNVPVTLALKYGTGKELQTRRGVRIMFTTTDDRCFFFDPDDARRIHELGLKPLEPFQIMKRKLEGQSAFWLVSPVTRQQPEPQQPVSKPAAAVATQQNRAVPNGPNNNGNGSTRKPRLGVVATNVMAGAFVAAIDAFQVGKDYAASKGIDPDWERIQAMACTIYIQHFKEVVQTVHESWKAELFGSQGGVR